MDVSEQRVVAFFSLQPVPPTQHLIEFACVKRGQLVVLYDKRNQHTLLLHSLHSLRPTELCLPKKYRCKSVEVLSQSHEVLLGTDRSELLVAKDSEVVRCLKIHSRDAVALTCIVRTRQKELVGAKAVVVGLSTGAIKVFSLEFELMLELQDQPEYRELAPVTGVEFLDQKANQLLVIREQPFSLSVVSISGGALGEIHRSGFDQVQGFQKEGSLVQ